MRKKHIVKISIVLFSLILLLREEIKAQYLPHYSQYMLHQTLINPAVMSSYDQINGSILYKKQWVGFEGAPETKGFDINVPTKRSESSIGFSIVDDRIDVSSEQRISIRYAYKLKLDRDKFLSFSLSPTLLIKKSRLSELAIQDNNDPQFYSDTPTLLAPNFKFGAYFFTNNFYVGLAIPDLIYNSINVINNDQFKFKNGFKLTKMHVYIHSGWQKKIKYKRIKFQPSILIKHIYGSPVQIDLNSHFLFYEIIGMGLSYRTLKTVVILGNYKINAYITVGYAYNMNFSKLSQFNSGSHEIILLYRVPTEKRKFRIDLPRF